MCSLCSLRFIAFFAFVSVSASAQIQQAWVARYTNGASQAVKMVLDSAGNVYVAGVSDGGYATIKYAPNGNQVWASRYNSGTPSGLVPDTSNNVIVTGSAATVKYDTNGLVQFDDTNAPNFDFRFYLTNPQ
jgi:hypothetical protein